MAGLLPLIPGLSERLIYDRSAILAGEIWRVVTCHLVHANLDHLLWNLAAFLVVTGLSAVLIPAGLLVFRPDLSTYCGLSGISSAAFTSIAAGLVLSAVREKQWATVATVGLLAAGFLGKILFESATGGALFVDVDAAALTPTPLAHLVGALAGLIECAARSSVCRMSPADSAGTGDCRWDSF